MKIVVLDGYTLNPGDLSWDALEALGDCTVHDRTPADRTVDRARGAEIVLTNKTGLDRAAVEALDDLRYVGVLATGFNVVDVSACNERGVIVANVPAYGARSVAQMTFALLLELCHHVGDHDRAVRQGRWSRCEDFCFREHPLIELDGLTMGVVGLGRIGRAVCELAGAFGLDVVACDVAPPDDPPAGVRMVDLDELLASADVVSLHCPLTDDTAGMIDAGRLTTMKPGAMLINTARGALLDGRAVADALNARRLGGAAVDVLTDEPPAPDDPLLTAKNCIVTPHIAWATLAARRRLLDTAVANVAAFIAGRPQNVVNSPAGREEAS